MVLDTLGFGSLFVTFRNCPNNTPLAIRTFNERWFQGWSATPEEQRVRLLSMAESIKSHPDFHEKYQNEHDPHHQHLAFDKLFKDVMLQRRKDDLEFYKLLASDAAFKAALMQNMQRMVAL